MRPGESPTGAPSNRARAAARSVVRSLPFPRDLAAAALWGDLRALVRGGPPGGISLREARLRHDAQPGRDLLRAGRPDQAIAAAAAVLSAAPSSLPALRLKLDAEVAAGRSRDALRTIRALRRLDPGAPVAALERRLAASVLVEDTDWVPGLPPALPCADPEGPSLVLVSPTPDRPQDRAWVERVLGAAVEAGLRPVVVDTWGQAPGGVAVSMPGAAVVVPADLGPGYPHDAPLDRRTLDTAWAAAAAARKVRPARIVAVVARGRAVLAAGLAVREATGCPLAVVVPPNDPGGQSSTSVHGLDRADRVVEVPARSGVALAAALRALDRPPPGPEPD